MARKVIQGISHNGKKYLSLNYAASLSGYHKDYLSQLIRQGEIEGEKIRNTWFIEESVFTRFRDRNIVFSSKPFSDPWDRLLLGEESVSPENNAKLSNLLNLKISAIKVLIVFLIFALSGTFLFKNHDLVLAKSSSLKIITEQTARQITSQTQLAAVSLQTTILDLPSQIRSLSLSLSRQTS